MRAVFAIGVALALAGCPDKFRRPDNAIEDPAVVLGAVERRSQAITALNALVSLEVWEKSERVRLKQMFIVERPDKLRVDTLSPFGQPLSSMASDGRDITIYSLDEKRYWTGTASPRNLARLIPIGVEGEELSALLRGGAPVIGHQTARLSWDGENGWYRVDLQGDGRRQRLSLEPAALRVVESRVWRDGALQYRARFGDYSGDDEAAIPRRMRFEVPMEALQIDLRVEEHEVNRPIDPAVFRIDPPRGVTVERLD